MSNVFSGIFTNYTTDAAEFNTAARHDRSGAVGTDTTYKRYNIYKESDINLDNIFFMNLAFCFQVF